MRTRPTYLPSCPHRCHEHTPEQRAAFLGMVVTPDHQVTVSEWMADLGFNPNGKETPSYLFRTSTSVS